MARDKVLIYSFAASAVINILAFVWFSQSDLFQLATPIHTLQARDITIYRAPLQKKQHLTTQHVHLPRLTSKTSTPKVKANRVRLAARIPTTSLKPQPTPSTPAASVRLVRRLPVVVTSPALTPKQTRPLIQQNASKPRVQASVHPSKPQPRPARPMHVAFAPSKRHPDIQKLDSGQKVAETLPKETPAERPKPMASEKHNDPLPEPPKQKEEPKQPDNYVEIATREEPEAIGGFPSPELPSDFDASELKGPCVLRITVDETGHGQVRIKKTSGSSVYDDACKDAARRVHFKPAVQDHIPQTAIFEQTYDAPGKFN